jgi:hypothetical protein
MSDKSSAYTVTSFLHLRARHASQRRCFISSATTVLGRRRPSRRVLVVLHVDEKLMGSQAFGVPLCRRGTLHMTTKTLIISHTSRRPLFIRPCVLSSHSTLFGACQGQQLRHFTSNEGRRWEKIRDKILAHVLSAGEEFLDKRIKLLPLNKIYRRMSCEELWKDPPGNTAWLSDRLPSRTSFCGKK